MNFFTNAKSLRLMAAAGVVAFYCGTAPALGATYTFTGVADAGALAFHEDKSTSYDNLSGDTIRAVGGNATTANMVGGGALNIGGNFNLHGAVEAIGGDATDVSGGTSDPIGGVGIAVGGNVTVNGILDAGGGKGTATNNDASFAYGGTGLIVAGELLNKNQITAKGGQGEEHDGRGGSGIKTARLVNEANITTKGGSALFTGTGSGIRPMGGSGIEVTNGFLNKGTIIADGGDTKRYTSGCTSMNHAPTGGAGISVSGADIANYGTIIATGGGYDAADLSNIYGNLLGGVGVAFVDYAENYGTITAQGGTINTPTGHISGEIIGGTGVTFANGFTNYETVLAKGGDAETIAGGAATGGDGLITSGGIYNYGDIVTQGGQKLNGAGTGTETPGAGAVFNDGLTSYKDAFVVLLGYDSLTNADVGAAIKLGGMVGVNPDLDHGAWFKLGSYLALGSTGGGAYIDAGGLDVVFEQEASGVIPVSAVISMVASSGSVGTTVTHTGFIQNTSSTLAGANLTSYTGPVMDVTFTSTVNATNLANNDFNFTAERIGWSSQQTTGNASSMLAAWERDLAGQGINDSNYAWAELLSSVDFQPNADALRQRARDLFGDTMPVATTQSMQSMGRAARFVDDLFSKNMQSLAKCRQTKACSYNANAYDPRKAGLVCGVDTDPLMIWAQPFYFTGRQNGKDDWFHKFDEDYYGVTTGVAYDADFAILSAELHYYQGNLKTRNYKADVDALGFELGIGRSFYITNNWCPWVELRAGYTWMELDQKRTDVNGVKATSKPDAGVWTGGITVNNAFSMTEQITITPKIGVDIMHMNMDGYTEKNSSLATKVKPDDYTSVQGTIGVQLDYNPTDDFYLEARAAYHYEFADKSADLKAHGVGLSSNLKIPGDDLSRSSATLGVGAGVKLTDNVSLQADYDVRLGDKYVGHQVSATLSFSF